ncbi:MULTISPECIES: FAD-dependent protein [Anaerococcus]|uniref:FAD-dependent oxidoreductase n=1 Tax=Anaerococcus octavius TaxID=54007 RepID=A0A2I1MAI1_9FIRM|nr:MULTISPECIES: NAD(P)/FAD-dependent oxidoreductase [Anaerococcus]MBS6105638.1 NAD(P)/FAD-dependent oxidoreductase [Anaerococcus sp.]PKZ17128.1 FAD-dependent oxidoreductase [Anaerococcus octavius]
MIIIRNINLESDNPEKLRRKISKLINKKNFDYEIYRKSIDSRKGIKFSYQVLVDINPSDKELKKIKNADRFEFRNSEIEINNPPEEVAIIGSGPSGLFTAYVLSQNGVKVKVYERGEAIEDRIKTIDDFKNSGKLNTESNIQFGEGGAGTYSDGKLTARSKDPRVRMVLETFHKHGAPDDIMIDAKPHIGTDLLRDVIINMREEIKSNGGEFYFSHHLDDINISDNKVKNITINGENTQSGAYVLAIGHSARDTFEMLSDKIKMENKNFAVGFRIEHKRTTINDAQYNGKKTDIEGNELPAASYNLSYNDKESGLSAYTFCMCPGGYVVNASSEENMTCVNGMSYHDRDGENSNAALIVTIGEETYGTNLLDGMKFQREIESKADKLGDGKVPVQKFIDFKENVATKELGEIKPSVESAYKLANLRGLYPASIDKMIIDGIEYMGNRLKGFADDDAILSGVETRSSSPIRMIRDKENKSLGLNNLYVVGEGSGHAGGIVSSAVDGIRTAEAILAGK